MDGWRTYALEELATVSAGNSAPQDKVLFQGGQHPFVRTSDVGKIRFGTIDSTSDYLNEAGIAKLHRFPRGTILFPKSGASTFLNHRVMMLVDGYVASHLATIQAEREKIHPWFLLYFLHTVKAQDLVQDHSYPSLNLPLIKSIQVPLPPLPEQERIVVILDEAFAAIATATANAEKNLANARELFESELNRVFSQKGEGWVERKFGDTDLLQIIDGDRGVNYPKKTDFHSYGHCLFLNTKNVRPDGYNFETTMFITEEKDNILRKGKLKRRDVVLTTRGTIGNIAIYNNDVEFEHIRINSGMLILRPNESKILSEYLFEVLRSPFIKKQFAEFTSGAAQPQLPIRTLVQFVLHVPKNLEAQTQIVAALRALSLRIKHMESIYRKKLDSLAELKQSTLHKAFTGKLTADSKAAERTLSEAGL